jgi:hypothetical protein
MVLQQSPTSDLIVLRNQTNAFYFLNNINYNIVEHIEEFKNYPLVIADLSSEHWSTSIDYVYQLLEENNINFILLTYNPADHLRKPRLLFYPWWYEWTKDNFNQRCLRINTLEKLYPVSCLNAAPRFNRIYNYLALRKKSYFDKMLFTMHRSDFDPGRHDDYKLEPSVAEEWNTIKDSLPNRNKIRPGVEDEIYNPAYSNSYINLITETTVLPEVFITEKTWKSVASGQLFLMIGAPGAVDHLRSLGVDTFDDIVDHKYYDTELNWSSRIDKVHELLDSLMAQDLYKLNQHTLARRQRNADNFFAGLFGQPYKQEIKTCINTLK